MILNIKERNNNILLLVIDLLFQNLRVSLGPSQSTILNQKLFLRSEIENNRMCLGYLFLKNY